MKKLGISAAIGLSLMLATGSSGAQAATATTPLAVSATVLAVCVAASVPLAFGNYTGVQLDVSTTLTVICTLGTTYNVGLDGGIGVGATTSVRKMSLLTNTLNYALYRDSNHTMNWGNTIGTDTVSATANGLLATYNVYGRIPAGQFSAFGAYLDTVGVTVTY